MTNTKTNLRLLSSVLRPRNTLQLTFSPTSRPLLHGSPAHHRPSSTSASAPAGAIHTDPNAAQPSKISSVSASETKHFSALASTWWDPMGPSRLLHQMNPLRHTFIASCLTTSNISSPSTSISTSTSPSPPAQGERGLTYLDIGCGGGIFSESAARLPSTASVLAIDPTPSVIQVARAHQRTDPSIQPPRLRYQCAAIEDLPSPTPPSSDPAPASTEGVDILTIFEVLEHVSHPSSFLESCIAHVRPGGWVIGSTIARSQVSWVVNKLIAEMPVFGVVPRGTHDWSKFVDPGEVAGWFEKRSRGKGREGKDGKGGERWGSVKTMGVVYIPGLGWKMIPGAEGVGNYFFGVQKLTGLEEADAEADAKAEADGKTN